MRERAVQFGTDVVHTGILCEPADAAAAEGRPVCLMLNAGLIHRVGPNRLHVNLARALAAAGYPSLRFDMSGRGDTDVRTDGETFVKSGIRETQSAMDYLEQLRGARRFVPMGICSGAHDAIRTAMVDTRIVGAVLIEFYVYPTPAHRMWHYLRRVTNAGSWADTLAGRNALGHSLRRRLGLQSGGYVEEPSREDLGGTTEGFILPRQEVDAALKTVADRGTELCFVYAGASGMCNYRGQLYDAYPSLRGHGQIRVAFFAGADHTFTRLDYQRELIDTVTRFMPSTDRAHLRVAS